MGGPPSPSSMRTTTACAGCHRRKTKCDGRSPQCTPCARRGSLCEPHLRARRSALSAEEERRMRERIAWLEEELARACRVSAEEARQTPTGIRMAMARAGGEGMRHHHGSGREATHNEDDDDDNDDVFVHDQAVVAAAAAAAAAGEGVSKDVDDIAADVAVLSLNATGELRFMGGASGVLFSKLIASIVKSSVHGGDDAADAAAPLRSTLPASLASHPGRREGEAQDAIANDAPPWDVAQHLLREYLQWTHMQYPIFHQSALQALFCSVYQPHSEPSPAEQTIFYLVMLIGACRSHVSQLEQEAATFPRATLFSRAMAWFAKVLPVDGIEGLQIVLLLTIYTSYQPTGSSQWHLLGIAMRLCIDMGLHRHNTYWAFDERQWDIRQRLFWATYVLDRTVCFNLGRPLTLSDEQIDAALPGPDVAQSAGDEPCIALAVHHIRLRQIQARIITEVYTAGRLKALTGEPQRLQILVSIQGELDQWREQLGAVYSPELSSHSFEWYERLYHTTTAALHRATPLFPRPSEASIRRCYEASSRAVRIYYSLWRASEMERSWMLIQGTFLAGITMLYTIWASEAFSQAVRIDEVCESCRMCSVVLAALGSGNGPSKFCSALETLTNLTTRKLLAQVQQQQQQQPDGCASSALYGGHGGEMSPTDSFCLDPGVYLGWPEKFNFHTALANPDSVTELFGELINWQGSG